MGAIREAGLRFTIYSTACVLKRLGGRRGGEQWRIAQYFCNFSGAETAIFVAEAIDIIGAPRTADICRRAIAVAYPHGLPAVPEEISAVAADFSDENSEGLRILDSEFLAYPHNLTDLLFAYVDRYPEEFGPLSEPQES